MRNTVGVRKTCRQCSVSFELLPEDLALFDKLSPVFGERKEPIPAPERCHDCRMQNLMAWRNERHLYRRTCSLCKRSVIALYPDGTSFPVYCTHCFFGDGWDPLAAGRTYDPGKPLFAQMQDLLSVAPRIALLSKSSENSDYTNHAADNRNCYLSFILFGCEDVLYSRKVFRSRNIVDCHYMFEDSELAYECFWCSKLYHCTRLINCFSMSESHYCVDCRNCARCFLCRNLRNKQNCFRNVQYAPEEYEKKIAAYEGSERARREAQLEFERMRREQTMYKNLEITNCENSYGDYLLNGKNLFDAYYSTTAEDMRHCVECDPSRSFTVGRDCFDVFGFGSSELLYEVQAMANGYGNIGCNFSYDIRRCLYCDNCHDAEDCFGCIGLRHKKHCVLNKQYTKEEYEALVPRIIERMRKDGEWGLFFPIELCPFAYNETAAQEEYPLTRAEAEKNGWRWKEMKDELPKVSRVIPADKLPDRIADIPDDVLHWAIECEATKRPFKLTKQELEFYRNMRLPVPRFHPDERHRRRMALRNPRKLWKRNCAKCGKEMQTSYAPDRPEIVVCEPCYLKEVY